VCVCSLRYPACNAHAPYSHQWSVQESFSPLSHKRHDFEKKSYLIQNVCFDFLYNFCLQHFSVYEEMNEIRLKMYIGLRVKCLFILVRV